MVKLSGSSVVRRQHTSSKSGQIHVSRNAAQDALNPTCCRRRIQVEEQDHYMQPIMASSRLGAVKVWQSKTRMFASLLTRPQDQSGLSYQQANARRRMLTHGCRSEASGCEYTSGLKTEPPQSPRHSPPLIGSSLSSPGAACLGLEEDGLAAIPSLLVALPPLALRCLVRISSLSLLLKAHRGCMQIRCLARQWRPL
jgi:hypothetical protein